MCACTFTAKLTPAAAALPLSLLPSHSAWSRWPGGGPAGQRSESSAGDSGSSEASVPCSLAVGSPGPGVAGTTRLGVTVVTVAEPGPGPPLGKDTAKGTLPGWPGLGGLWAPAGGPVGPGADHPSFDSEPEPRPGPLRPGCHCRLAWGRRMRKSKGPVYGRAGAHLTRTPGLSLIQTGT